MRFITLFTNLCPKSGVYYTVYSHLSVTKVRFIPLLITPLCSKSVYSLYPKSEVYYTFTQTSLRKKLRLLHHLLTPLVTNSKVYYSLLTPLSQVRIITLFTHTSLSHSECYQAVYSLCHKSEVYYTGYKAHFVQIALLRCLHPNIEVNYTVYSNLSQ